MYLYSLGRQIHRKYNAGGYISCYDGLLCLAAKWEVVLYNEELLHCTLSYFVDLLKTPYGREIDMRKLEISWRAYLCVKKSIVDFFFPLFKKPHPSKCYFDGGGECYSTIYIVF